MNNRFFHHALMGLCWLIILAGIAASLVQHFVLTLPKTTAQPSQTDGIIVTTGGQARLQAGLDLLRDKKAPRLLISGVGNGITKQMIADSLHLSEDEMALFACCVSLDFAALDTLGNAQAAKSWADSHDMSALLLVTSDYHMPRAALEFTALMPDYRIIAYPITPPDLAGKSWYQDWASLRLYAREYLKYSVRRLTLLFGA